MSKVPAWLPDWEDKSQYPDLGVPLYQWAWEFLRRNQDYQKAWQELIAPFFDKKGLFDIEAARAYEPALKENERFSDILSVIEPEPREPLQFFIIREWFGTLGCPPPPWVSKVEGGVPFVTITTRVRLRPTTFPRPYFPFSDTIRDGQAVVWFNLDYPLKSQLARVEAILKEAQLLRPSSKNADSRKRLDLYADYLRLLDAEAKQIPVLTVAETIFPHLSNDYPEPDGIRTVRDKLEAAQKLRDGDYLFIPSTAPSKKK